MDTWTPLILPFLGLESFSWTCIPGKTITTEEIQCIAALKTLRSLELSLFERFADVKPLQSLPLLQKLTLQGCASLGEKLLQHGAFPSLIELRIDDDYPEDAMGYPDVQMLYLQGRGQILPPEVAERVEHLGLFQEGRPDVIGKEALSSLRALMKVRAVKCMIVVLQMPKIRKISGNGTLLRLGFCKGLPGWARTESGDWYKL